MKIYLLRNQIPQNKKANIKRSSITSDQIENILDANSVDDDSEEKKETLIKKIRKVRPKSKEEIVMIKLKLRSTLNLIMSQRELMSMLQPLFFKIILNINVFKIFSLYIKSIIEI